MAYGWKCHYGWFKGVRVASSGGALNGNNISNLHFTDTLKYFSLSATDEVLTPHSTSDIDIDTALTRLRTWTEHNYCYLIPCRLYNTAYNQLAPGCTAALEDYLLPRVWTQCPVLAMHEKHIYTLEPNEQYTTFAYLYELKRIIDASGMIYTVASDGTITQLTGGAVTQLYNSVNGFSGPINNTSATFTTHVFNDLGGITKVTIFFGELTISGTYGTYRVYYNLEELTETQVNYIKNTIFQMNTREPDIITDPADPTTDPYTPPFTPSNPSGPGGGGGTHNIPPTDSTPIPTGTDLPNPSALGLYHLYNPSSGQLAALGMELYGLPDSDLKLISRMVNSPMESILSVHCLPYAPASSGAVPVQLGHYSATATAAVCTYDHEIIDCGNLKIDEIWGSYLDYNMSVSLYLPFVGFVPLKPDDVIGKTLNVMYICDNATGSFCSYIKRADDGVVLGTFGGNCSYQIPLTATNYSEIIHAITGLAASAISGGAALATGGLAAPIAAGLASSALNVATSKKHYETAGGLGTNTGFMGVRVPYIKVMVPNACVPQNQNRYKGYPSYMTRKIGNLSGYTEIEAIHLDMLPATPTEIDEIRRRLSEGVYL